MDWAFVSHALSVLGKGVVLTLTLVAVSVALGFPLGLGLALMRLSSRPWVAGAARLYGTVFRGTPLLVQLFLFYYGLGQFAPVRDNPALWWVIGNGSRCAILALTLNTAAYTSEILRGGLLSVPQGLVEAARAAGMSPALLFWRIRFPLAIRQALPAYGNELILTVKGSSLASTITVMEITGHAKRLMSQTYAIFEVFALAGLIYLAINIALVGVVRAVEGRLAAPR